LSIIVSDWERFILFNGELTSIPIALQKDNRNYEVTKKMQSKLEWYYTFTRYNINTPKVFYNGKTLLNPISPDIETFIKKPIYGTEGSKVSKINKRDLNSAFEESYIIQEYISDCFTDFARHIRIMTYCDNANKCHVFFIKEDRQSTDSITSNRSNKGTIQTICKNNFCDFLSRKEQRQITHVSKKLLKLHQKEFNIVPFIGWDVSLSSKGPIVFEGNLGGGMNVSNEIYAKYKQLINALYSSK
jgi:hypothetical protein